MFVEAAGTPEEVEEFVFALLAADALDGYTFARAPQGGDWHATRKGEFETLCLKPVADTDVAFRHDPPPPSRLCPQCRSKLALREIETRSDCVAV